VSAAPTMDLLPSNVIEAQIAKMEQDEIIIRALKKKNERLAQEKLEAELEASVKIAALKGEKADLAARIEALEKAQDRTGNLVQGLVLTPSRDEFDRLRERVEGLCAREVV
jgi:F0F1-type ATP synthase gamma subunit